MFYSAENWGLKSGDKLKNNKKLSASFQKSGDKYIKKIF